MLKSFRYRPHNVHSNIFRTVTIYYIYYIKTIDYYQVRIPLPSSTRYCTPFLIKNQI